jgi:threonine/homoserine/homoserine lactone efflux protein
MPVIMSVMSVTLLPAAVIGLAWLVSAGAFAIAMAGTPGPNNAMLTSSGSLWGFRRTVPHMLGISIGFPIMQVCVAAGLGSLLRENPSVLTVLRWLGAAYLLYLAWKIATTQPEPRSSDDPEERRGASRRPMTFLQAALFQWVNPKAWLVTISALATVASVGGHPSTTRAFILAGVFLTVTLPITALWTMVGVGVSRVFTSARALRRFNVAMALLLVASLVSVLAGLD